jgi:hypothetical protein
MVTLGEVGNHLPLIKLNTPSRLRLMRLTRRMGRSHGISGSRSEDNLYP